MKRAKKVKIIKTRAFNKSLKKCSLKIKKQTKRRINLYLFNPKAPILHNHKLKGKFRNTYSINITGDYRLLLRKEENPDLISIYLMEIGTHAELY